MYMVNAFLLALLLFAALAAGARPAVAAEVAAASKIEAVTVFPAGAEITRLARVRLAKGEHQAVFGDLPAAAERASIRVEGRAAGRLEIGSVDTRRLFISRADAERLEAERKRLEDEIEKLTDERSAHESGVLAAETQKTLIANLAQLPVRPAPATPGGAAPPEDWRQILALISSGTAEASRALLEAQIKIRELDRRIEDLRKQLSELSPRKEERTEVRVNVASAADMEAEFVLRYRVPGAYWVPYYDARLATGGKDAAPRLSLTRQASVTQRTGETWENVSLQLSTSRPSAGSAAPEIRPMTADFEPEPRPAAPPAPVPEARTMMRQRGAPLGAGGRYAEGIAPQIEAGAEKGEAKEPEAAEFQGAAVESTPFQTVFAVPGRQTVPGTGEPKRVHLLEEAFEAALAVRTVPKFDAKGYLYAKFALGRAGSPVLPGEVSLFRDGMFTGTGSLPVLAPGETHELGFGVDDLVRVRHTLIAEKRGEVGLISSSRTDERSFRLTVKNLHERAVDLLVLDQVPASQNEAIKVDSLGRPPSKRDWDERRGVFAWEHRLEPDEEYVIEFGYRVTWPAQKRIVYRP